MDYIAFGYQAIWFWPFLGLIAVLFISGLFFLRASDKAARAGNEAKENRLLKAFYTILVAALLCAAIGGMLLAKSSTDARYAWRETVASSLSTYYGVTVTPKNVQTLSYPEDAPTERVYLGTAKLATGESMDEFAEVTLGISDGKVYLLEQDGATYTELEPATAR